MNMGEIVEASKYIGELEEKYGPMRRVTGSIGRWFSRERHLFFDCGAENLEECAERLVSSPSLETLIVYFVVKGPDSHQLRDSRFKNIYSQSLRRMIEHFHNVLEPSIRHGMQVAGLAYIESVGYGVVIKERARETVSDVSEIRRIMVEETGVRYETKEYRGTTVLRPAKNETQPIVVDQIRISENILTLYAPEDKSLTKPDVNDGPEWEAYHRSVVWKDAMTLTIREKYYGIMVFFDGETCRYAVELSYPVEEEKIRKACHAIGEALTLQ
jgi:hypothetical protein